MPRFSLFFAGEILRPGGFVQVFSLPVEIDCYLPRITGPDGSHAWFRKPALIFGNEFIRYAASQRLDIQNTGWQILNSYFRLVAFDALLPFSAVFISDGSLFFALIAGGAFRRSA